MAKLAPLCALAILWLCYTSQALPYNNKGASFPEVIQSDNYHSDKQHLLSTSSDVVIILSCNLSHVIVPTSQNSSTFSLPRKLNISNRSKIFILCCDNCTKCYHTVLSKVKLLTDLKISCNRSVLFPGLISFNTRKPHYNGSVLACVIERDEPFHNILQTLMADAKDSVAREAVLKISADVKLIPMSSLKKYISLDRRKHLDLCILCKICHHSQLSIWEKSFEETSQMERNSAGKAPHYRSAHMRQDDMLNSEKPLSKAGTHNIVGQVLSSYQKNYRQQRMLIEENYRSRQWRRKRDVVQVEDQKQEQQSELKPETNQPSGKVSKLSNSFTPLPNMTEIEKWFLEDMLRRQVQREGQIAYLCLVFIICLILFALWYMRGFHSRIAKKKQLTFHDKSHLLTVKEVVFRKARYLPMFYRDDGLEEVFVHDCGNDP